MKKLILILSLFFLLFTSCSTTTLDNPTENIKIENIEEKINTTIEEKITKELDEEIEIEIGELI